MGPSLIGRRFTFHLAAWLLSAVLAGAPALASDSGQESRFQLGLSFGGFHGRDEVRSDAGDILTLTNGIGEVQDRYVDPREDAAVSGKLDIRPGVTATVSARYAVTRIFRLEASLGYHASDVGQIEIQAKFVPSIFFSPRFRTFRIDAGELERVPLQITALASFRPDAGFRPYVGAGLGYTFVGFSPSPELDQLSIDLDNSKGALVFLRTELAGGEGSLPANVTTSFQLSGASVDARDSFDWHLAGGVEFVLAPRWTLFLDLRFSASSRSLGIGFNNGEDLGVSVPQRTAQEGSEFDADRYGPMLIDDGGLIDEDGDGEPDTGYYYINGGTLDYTGTTAQIGVRFEF